MFCKNELFVPPGSIFLRFRLKFWKLADVKINNIFLKKWLMAYGVHFWPLEAVLENSLNVRLMFERLGSFVGSIFLGG